MIPEKKNQAAARKKRGQRGGRPPAFDSVERSFVYVKQWRGMATRIKLAIVCRVAVVISAVLAWLRQ